VDCKSAAGSTSYSIILSFLFFAIHSLMLYFILLIAAFSDFGIIHNVSGDQSHSCPISFDSIDESFLHFICFLEVVYHTLHCSIVFPFHLALHLLYFFSEGIKVRQAGVRVSA